MAILSIISWWNEKRELRVLKKRNQSSQNQETNKVLYQWIGKGDFDYIFLYQITNIPLKLDLLENLKNIKNKYCK